MKENMWYDDFKVGDTIRYDINEYGRFNGETKDFILTQKVLDFIIKYEDESNYHRMRVVKPVNNEKQNHNNRRIDMAIIKHLTEKEHSEKKAMEERVLQLYRELNKLEYEKDTLRGRIEHLEKQINNIGGPGIDIDKILKKR